MFQLYFMGILYAILGVFHFTHTHFYRLLMPKFLPAHDFLIYASGWAEIIMGICVLYPGTRNWALWGIISMLLVFLLIHVNMLFPENQLGISSWILWLRILLQFLLIYWAFSNLSPNNI